MTSLAHIASKLDRRVAQSTRTKTVLARNTAPVVSITFDDFPASASRTGADILEARGVRGSYYLCGDLAEREWENGPQFTPDDLQRLVQNGHEIGCHTYEHLDCTRTPGDTLRRSISRNQAYVRDVLGDTTLSTFAYPYGYYGTAAKLRLQNRFAACRGINPGVNTGRIDLGLLKAVAIPHDAVGDAWIAPWLEQVRATNGWLILFTHDVRCNPGRFGCTPDLLSATIDAIQSAGIEILPLKNALGRVAFGPG